VLPFVLFGYSAGQALQLTVTPLAVGTTYFALHVPLYTHLLPLTVHFADAAPVPLTAVAHAVVDALSIVHRFETLLFVQLAVFHAPTFAALLHVALQLD